MGDAAAIKVEIDINGKPTDESNFQAYTVERDMFQPDMAQIVLSNQGDVYTTSVNVGDDIEIKIGDDGTSVFKGELVGVEPIYKGGEKTKVILRALNKLHRLVRVRKSMTYTDKSDKDILSQVLSDAGLQIDWKCAASVQYKHVYQHNQSALEFLRMRAARVGAYVWCVDSTVYVHDPETQGKPIKTLTVDNPGDSETALREFRPRLSSAQIVKKVTVKGWNPETKQLITGQASAQNSSLGSQNAAAGASKLAGDETFTVDHPIWSTEEANMLAKARMQDASMSYITGEAICSGDPAFDIGKVVQVTANADKDANSSTDPFNGNYYVVGLTHRHNQSKSKDGGYTTILRLARDAQKQ